MREIEDRLKSIKNIEKITNTMKIVASTRLNKAQRAMQASRVFNETDKEFKEIAEPSVATEEDQPAKTLLIVVSSDKGLCGSIHSTLAKYTRKRVNELNGNASIVTLGDKLKQQLLRTHSQQLKLAFSGTLKQEPTFVDAALVADEISKLGEFDKTEIIYNRFVSNVSFEASEFSVFNNEAITKAPGLSKYELESEDATNAISEFGFANDLLSAMAEGYASEISARRNAMDNASKNAGDMINNYSILYNRTRQAVITNELVDIITGASSLE